MRSRLKSKCTIISRDHLLVQSNERWYQEDLAYLHDVGHRDCALKSAPCIIAILAQNNIRDGLVVDLGCGSG
jgi:hypothetical protein